MRPRHRLPIARPGPGQLSRLTPCPEKKKNKLQSVGDYKKLGANRRETFKKLVEDMKATGANPAICH